MTEFSNYLNCGHNFIPNKSSFNIKKGNILRTMGMEISNADDYLNELISELTEESKKLCEPEACYIFFKDPYFNSYKNELTLNKMNFNLGKMVSAFLKKSSFIAVFVATIGNKIENLSKKMIKEGHTLEGLIIDILGSELAEETAEYVHHEIQNIAEKKGFHITNRYSPGYCNWPVNDQQKLFPLLNGNTCGIHLTPSSLMLPIKSVSGIVGIGHDVKQLAYKCHLCTDEKCILRGRK